MQKHISIIKKKLDIKDPNLIIPTFRKQNE